MSMRRIVNIESPFWSKINWVQVVAVIASILVLTTGGKVNLTPEQQAVIASAIQIVSGVVTVILKTYYTTTVTPQASTELPKAE
jgi:choline-glycine betaine transporter